MNIAKINIDNVHFSDNIHEYYTEFVKGKNTDLYYIGPYFEDLSEVFEFLKLEI